MPMEVQLSELNVHLVFPKKLLQMIPSMMNEVNDDILESLLFPQKKFTGMFS